MRYTGWVRVRHSVDGEEWWAENSLNTVSGSCASKSWWWGERPHAALYVPGEGWQAVFDPAKGVVRVGAYDARMAGPCMATFRDQPFTTDHLKGGMREGDWVRYDVAVEPPCPECASPGAVAIESWTIWAAPVTGLAQRMEWRAGGRVGRSEYSYGGTGVRDIYDLGVPREACVVDERGAGR